MNRLACFEQYPMTASSADFLASVYGGVSIDAFSKSLPEGAEIVDVGAGLSVFGHEVASRRPDIVWTNFDNNYKETHVSSPFLDGLAKRAPFNLRYIKGDVIVMPDNQNGRYDKVYSYNLIPHILRADLSFGIDALRNITRMLSPEGTAMVGPISDGSERRGVCTLDYGAGEQQIHEAAAAMRTSWLANIYHDAVFRSGVALYPARRFDPATNAKAVLSENGGLICHPLMSASGLRLAGRLAAGLLPIGA